MPLCLHGAAGADMEWFGVNLHWAYGRLLPRLHGDLRCLHRAQDVLHDALLRFALTRSPARAEQPHAYLTTIARNLCIDAGHDARRWVSLTPVNEHAGPVVPETAFVPSAEDIASLRQRLGVVQRLLDSLPPRCREVFWQFRIEGHSQQDIARRLGISVNMVQRHIVRAMLDLLDAQASL